MNNFFKNLPVPSPYQHQPSDEKFISDYHNKASRIFLDGMNEAMGNTPSVTEQAETISELVEKLKKIMNTPPEDLLGK